MHLSDAAGPTQVGFVFGLVLKVNIDQEARLSRRNSCVPEVGSDDRDSDCPLSSYAEVRQPGLTRALAHPQVSGGRVPRQGSQVVGHRDRSASRAF